MASESERPPDATPERAEERPGATEIAPGEAATLDQRDRVPPTWTSGLAAAASKPFGGPLGTHAMVGTHWFWTPLRVVLLLAVLTLTLGWFSKAACIQEYDPGDGSKLLDWRSDRAYVALCYSDTVPLYGAERVNRDGFFPYRDGWLEVKEKVRNDDGHVEEKTHAATLYAEEGDSYRLDGSITATDSSGSEFTLDKGEVISLSGDRALRVGGETITLQRGSTLRFMEYPVLTGLFQWVNAQLTHSWLGAADGGLLPGAIPVAVYFNITALFLAFAWLVTVWAVARTARRRIWDAALVAISPLVIVHAFTNFDTLATAAAACAILAWSRKRPALAGVLLGLGAAAKLYPLFLLGPLLILCLRAGKTRTWLQAAAVAAGTWLAVNLPIALAFPDGWREFLRLNSERGMDPDSVYNVISYFSGWPGFDGQLAPGETPTVLNAVSGLLFVACCAGIAYIALAAPVRPRVAHLCFLVVAAFLLTNKVWSPQFSLWLVPLAVLALPRWRLLLAWMTVDALVWAPRMFHYLGVDNKGLPEDWFLGAVVLRDLFVIGLCALIIYHIYRPSVDPVREHGDDDPAGGVLDRARDEFVLFSRDRPDQHERRTVPT